MSEVNENNKNLGSKIFNFLLWILLLCLLFIPGYFFYNSFLNNDDLSQAKTEKTEETNTNSKSEPETSDGYTEEENIIEENTFYEEFPVINTQQSYIAVPTRIDTENPPSIVIYNHGDLEELADSISTDLMKKLQKYAEIFTANNYIFAASYVHNNIYASSLPLDDINALISWINDNYPSSEKIYIIGFSRGGHTTTEYILTYPKKVKVVALIAPTTYYTDWEEEQVNTVMDIPIKIWHGTDDKNVPIIRSENFVSKLEEYGKTVEIVRKEGEDSHQTEIKYINEILEFFESIAQ